jgi:predicted signal transduction protein with EAL and GGDEF domain
MSLTISGGIAQACEGDTQDTLVSRADSALYQAKSAGRNSVYYQDGDRAVAVVLAAEQTATAFDRHP